jgi:hypothetical protein
MHDKLRIIYKNDEPYGIRDENGFLLYFPQAERYIDHDIFYDKIERIDKLAKYLLEALEKRAVVCSG